MSSAHTPILMGVVSTVLEILQLLKMAKFPFWTMIIRKFNQLESGQKIHASRD